MTTNDINRVDVSFHPLFHFRNQIPTEIHLIYFLFLESVQEQLGEAEGQGLRAAFRLSVYSHR